MNRIKRLSPSVARKIAAGEVIEKPASVLRELLDNSIDSNATEIEVRLTKGGIDEILVSDNGFGMNPDDLELSIMPHATSKISSAEDLYALSTMGFRGEALSSVAACSRLQITSRQKDSETAYQISCENGEVIQKTAVSGTEGTTVLVKDLFYSMPGRRKFMKSTTGESTSCINVFMDKAAAFPSITFRIFTDGKLKYFLPAGSYLERVSLLYKKRIDTAFLREEEGIQEGPAKLRLVTTTPSTWRRDRKQIQIFINNRRIQEFNLIQAVEYGYSELLPGGCYPSTFLYITIDPAVVDFNIHPAKREVKIHDIKPLRRQVVASIKHFLSQFRNNNRYVAAAERIENLKLPGFKTPAPLTNNPISTGSYPLTSKPVAHSFSQDEKPSTQTLVFNKKSDYFPSKDINTTEIPDFIDPLALQQDNDEINQQKHKEISDIKTNDSEHQNDDPANIKTQQENITTRETTRYLGTFRNFFILAERGDTLYLIDQHAAHERILFNQFSKPETVQNLLVPITIKNEDGDALTESKASNDNFFFSKSVIENLKECGIIIQLSSDKIWEITSLPVAITSQADTIASLLTTLPDDLFELRKKLFATLACRAAVKEGDLLDANEAAKLAKATLELPEPTCPHGRPVFFSLSEGELCQLVGRDF